MSLHTHDRELQAPLLQPSLAEQVKSLKQQRALLWLALAAALLTISALVALWP